jgi:hypothetical protein
MIIISSLGERTQKYCLVDSNGGALTSATNTEMPLVDMVDMNRDGMTDLVFVDSEAKQLRVLYNQQKMQVKDDNKNFALCRESQFDNFSTPFYPAYPFNDATKTISFDLGSNTLTGAESGTFTGLASTDSKNPGRARLVDINVDSFPDVVITGTYSHAGTSSVTLSTYTFVVMNVGDETCTDLCVREFTRDKDSKQFEYNEKLTALAGDSAQLITFLDIDETG